MTIGDNARSVRRNTHLHNFGQNTLHILGMHKEYQRPVCANPWFAKHAFAHRLKFGLCSVNIGHFVTDMMLPTRRIFLQKRGNLSIARQRLN